MIYKFKENRKAVKIYEAELYAFTASNGGILFASAARSAVPLKSKNARLPIKKWMKQPWLCVTNEPKSVPTMHCHPVPYDSSNSCMETSTAKDT